MAGEIFIAKEATSQDIKTIVDANGVALSSLSTNLATVNANVNTINTNVSALKQPNGNNYRYYMIDSETTIPTLSSQLTVSGAGFLYSAVMFATSTSNPGGRIKVVIDGITLFDIDGYSSPARLSAAGHSVGAVNIGNLGPDRPFGAAITSGLSSSSFLNASGFVFPNNTTQQKVGGCVFMLHEPIRFKNSLVVYGQKYGQTVYAIEYTID